MAKKTIADVDVRGMRVLMRVDYNVPMVGRAILEDRRIIASLATLRSVLERGGKLILLSHLGRPEGDRPDPDLSLRPVAERLRQVLGRPVTFVPECVGEQARRAVAAMEEGQVVMLENLRFHPGEIGGDAQFARQLADLGDVYCNNAFGTAHREHASMVALPLAMAGKPRVAGFLLQREIQYLREHIQSPRRPFVAVIGGAKVEDKIQPLGNLLDRLDAVLIGGRVAYAFMEAEHKSVGRTELDTHEVRQARQCLAQALRGRARLHLPVDHLCGHELSSHTRALVFQEVIDHGWTGYDIGPRTVVHFAQVLGEARTIFWYGVLGAYETHPFDVGTKEIALAIVRATLLHHAVSIVAGTSAAGALELYNLADNVSHVSTGGRATLEMLEGKPFRSVELLDSW